MTGKLAISRRAFLQGLAAAGTVAATEPIFAIEGHRLPTLYRDGVHDDGPALQAMIDGQKVVIDGKIVDFATEVWPISNARMLTRQTLQTNPTKRGSIVLKDCQITCDASFFLRWVDDGASDHRRTTPVLSMERCIVGNRGPGGGLIYQSLT